MAVKRRKRESEEKWSAIDQTHGRLPTRKKEVAGPAASLFRLHRLVGNRSVGSLLMLLQPKLTISEPGDPSELEADRVADEIISTPEPTTEHNLRAKVSRLNISRSMCPECEEEEMNRVGKAEGNIGLKRSLRSGLDASVGQVDLHALRNRGEPLPDSERAFFEPRFGWDFSQVRVHTDGQASEAARGLGARAFTLGRDIAFAEGEYAPQTMDGRRLLAHELTHVVQQQGDEVQNKRLQRLKATGHGAGVKGKCGMYERQWVFALDSPAPDDGYIIQKIDFHEQTAGCDKPMVDTCPATPSLTFWEAWFVKKGDKVDWTTTRDAWTDQSAYGERKDSSGTLAAIGHLKFYKKSVTGNLGDFGVAGTAPGWGIGKEPQSGGLPSTHTEPTWWKDPPTEGPARRVASTWWNCCGDVKKQFSDIDWDP